MYYATVFSDYVMLLVLGSYVWGVVCEECRHKYHHDKPVYWNEIEPVYREISRAYQEVLSKSKASAEAFHELWRRLREKQIIKDTREKSRLGLRRQVWMALERLKAKYNVKFSKVK